MNDFLLFSRAKLDILIGKKPGKIVLAEFKHQMNLWAFFASVCFCSTNFNKFNHILMTQLLQDFNLTQGSDGKALALVFHQDLLQGDHSLRFLAPSFPYFAKSPLPNFGETFVLCSFIGTKLKRRLQIMRRLVRVRT